MAKKTMVEEFRDSLQDPLHKRLIARYTEGATVAELVEECRAHGEVMIREASEPHCEGN